MKSFGRIVLFALFGFLLVASTWATAAAPTELPPGLQIPDAARPGPDFDVDKATQAYIDLLSPAQKAQSDAYFEGGYWLQLWGLLYGLVVAWILLRSGLSRRMRDVGRRMSKKPWLQTMIYAAQWVLLLTLLSLPWTIYTEFFREHAYGLATQNFGEWSLDQFKGLIIELILLSLVLTYLCGRAQDRREVVDLASGGTFVLALFMMMLSPVFIDPLFNDYKPCARAKCAKPFFHWLAPT